MIEPMSPLPSNRFERLGRWCARHRWPVALSWLALESDLALGTVGETESVAVGRVGVKLSF